MYKDIISYQLAEGITESHLLAIAQQIVQDWMHQQAGFLGWEIHRQGDESYTDIVYWESREHAKQAEAAMTQMPNAADWYACYKEGSISSQNLQQVAKF